eukprot:COSAG01_NODE_38227_length_492_cov_1.063613_1_plen_73_part_01
MLAEVTLPAAAATKTFTVVEPATVRAGISPQATKTQMLHPGQTVLVYEQLQCEGHLRGRISPTEWLGSSGSAD